jgi:apolipoprotein N-acyltransferase
VLTLAFPEPDLAFVAWIAPVVLLLGAKGTTWRRGFLLGAMFGLGFFGTLLYWISIIGWAGWVLLIALQALFLGTFGAFWAVASRTENVAVRVLAAPVLWVAIEYVRSLFPLRGFTWGQIAQSQHNLEWMLRPARFGGGWLVAFAVLLIASLIAEAIPRLIDRRLAYAGSLVGLAGLIAAVPLVIQRASVAGESLRVAIVQGNVPRDFSGSVTEKDLAILDSHKRLTQGLEDLVDLVVWPESSVGIDLDENPAVAEAVGDSARSAGAPMIVGANLDIDADRYKVVALHVSAEGDVVDRYQKTHLVPFGEYVPGRDLIGWLPILDQVPRDAVRADEPTVFDVAGGRVAPVISFEGDFGTLVRGRIDEGGRLLVVATNTSTWGDSWASAQHVAFSQVRAAENGVWTIHAALSGISAFIAPDGTVVDRTPLWTATTLQDDIRFSEEASFYARTGDWVAWLCLLGTLLLVALGRRRVDREQESDG